MVRPLLHRALAEDVKRSLERDDVGGMRASDREACVAGAAHDLVDAVQEGEHSDLDGGAVGAREGGEGHVRSVSLVLAR